MKYLLDVGLAMPNILWNNKALISLERVELVCVFVACSYTTMDALYYYTGLVRWGLAYPKFSEVTNYQYLWKRLNDFADFLHVAI